MAEDVNKTTIPTLRQISQKAGVALSTVSLALRGHPNVSQETAVHVRAIAERMGWKANPMVSAWLAHVRQGKDAARHSTLAYLVNYAQGIDRLFHDPNFYIPRTYMNGARTRANQRGYSLEVLDYRELGEHRVGSILYNQNIQGVVLAPLDSDFCGYNLNWDAFALGTIAYSLVVPPVDRVANHHFHTVSLCMQNLYARGYRRIGLAMSEGTNLRSGDMFLGAYLSNLYRMEKLRKLKPFFPSKEAFNIDNFSGWIQQQKPDVVMALYSDVPRWLNELGYSIPDEIGYAHLDLPSEGEVYLPFAGINQQPEQIGATTIDLVAAKIDRNERGIPASPQVSLVDSLWVDGPSLKQRV
ncbi:LacI family DNA-binding transcriptional regulator [Coraliomargarita sp. SDUM461004]|uniref:LacI family DNA-binding transcriptional regulator n=1 Tax=Thalassobacterium sedimentorum TaxID=3041258 RepID=A0ABU1ADM1_9BACT|nr:substrate-binding domain-containing protein [Coraliomargarita sp. SDUM461004]MDQ8192812.1 LacI family DNA-binding transcriptional regulator [Coraliomargarita sp. SDUM461004]